MSIDNNNVLLQENYRIEVCWGETKRQMKIVGYMKREREH